MTTDAVRPSLVELRVLEGANLYFPRAAVKLTLDITTLLELADADARAVGGAARAGRRATGRCRAPGCGSGSRCGSPPPSYAGSRTGPGPAGSRSAAARRPTCTGR